MEKIILKAVLREGFGKGAAKHLRKEGQVPSVIYKDGKGGVNVQVDTKDLWHALHTEAGENAIITVDISGAEKRPQRTVIVKEIQADPINDRFLHVDFYEISLKEKLKVKVPVAVKGEAVGVKEDEGVLAPIMWEVEVECLPTDIPEHIDVTVDELRIGDAIHVGALVSPAGVVVLDDPEQVVVTVNQPAAEEEVVEEELGEGEEEPEVIKKGKKEEEEEGGEAPAEEAPPTEGGEEKKRVEKYDNMKIIVGLGNPGLRYRLTRHNIGFLVLKALSKKYRLPIKKKGFQGVYGVGRIVRQEVMLFEPLTYMNLSGEAVNSVCSSRLEDKNDLLVVSDDINLPFGSIRIRQQGSSGGHNGLQSVIERIGTDFSRLRIGVKADDRIEDMAAYVLSSFPRSQRSELPETVERAVGCIEIWLSDGIEEAMVRSNERT